MRASISGASEASFSGDALQSKSAKDAGKNLRTRNDVGSKGFQSGHDSSGWDRKARWQRAFNMARSKMGITGMDESVEKWGAGSKDSEAGGGGGPERRASAAPVRRGSFGSGGGAGAGGVVLAAGPPGTIAELRTPVALKEHLKRGRGAREAGITLATLEAGLDGPPEEAAAALVAQFDQRRQVLGPTPLNAGNRSALSPADRVLKVWANNGGAATATMNSISITGSSIGANGGGSCTAFTTTNNAGGDGGSSGGAGGALISTRRFSDAGSSLGVGGGGSGGGAGGPFPSVRRSSVIGESIIARPTSGHREHAPLFRVSVDTAAAAAAGTTAGIACGTAGGPEDRAAGNGYVDVTSPRPAGALRRQSSGALSPTIPETQQHLLQQSHQDGGSADGGSGGDGLTPLRPTLSQRPVSAGRRPTVLGLLSPLQPSKPPQQPSSPQAQPLAPAPTPAPLLVAVRTTSPERRRSSGGGAVAAPPASTPIGSLPRCGSSYPASPSRLPPQPQPLLQLPPAANRSPPRSTDHTSAAAAAAAAGPGDDPDIRRLPSPSSDATSALVSLTASSPTATSASVNTMPIMPTPPPPSASSQHDAGAGIGGPRRPRPRTSLAGDGSPSGMSASQLLPVMTSPWAVAPPPSPSAPPAQPSSLPLQPLGSGSTSTAEGSVSSSTATSAASSASELVPPTPASAESASAPSPAAGSGGAAAAATLSPPQLLAHGPGALWPSIGPTYRRTTTSSPGTHSTGSGAPPAHLYGSATFSHPHPHPHPQPPASPPAYRLPHAPPPPPGLASATATGSNAPNSPSSPAYRRASITGSLVPAAAAVAGGCGGGILGSRSAANSPSGKFPAHAGIGATASGIQLRLPVGSAIAAITAARVSTGGGGGGGGGTPGEDDGAATPEGAAAPTPAPLSRHSGVGLGGMKAAPLYVKPPVGGTVGSGSGCRTPNSDSVLADLRVVATEVDAELTREAEVAAAIRQAQSQALRSRIRMSDNGKLRHVGMLGDPWRKW